MVRTAASCCAIGALLMLGFGLGAAAGGDVDGANPGPVAQAGGGDAAGPSPQRLLQILDQDGDGTLSHAEFVETPRPGNVANTELAERNRAAHFDQLDVDGDGRLTVDELAELPGISRRGG